ncbi:MAG: rhomboid family intramembrane serine protease [Actinomycetota bacterium]
MSQASVGFHCPECARSGSQRVVRARDIRTSNQVPITVGLIVVNVIAYLFQGSNLVFGDPARTVTGWGRLFGPDVADGEVWRIVTAAFLHGSLIHIGFNMYLLWALGQHLERGLGTARYLLVYAAGLLGGSLAVLAFNFNAPTLGASGAVLGLAGAMAAVLWARGVPLNQSPVFGLVILNLALPLLIPGISFWGHLGGIVGGFVAGWLLTWLPERFGRPMNVAVGATAGWCAVLAALALAAPGFVSG